MPTQILPLRPVAMHDAVDILNPAKQFGLQLLYQPEFNVEDDGDCGEQLGVHGEQGGDDPFGPESGLRGG